MKINRILLPLLVLLAGRVLAEPQNIELAGALPVLRDVQVESANVRDYTFTSAPTDWWVQSGVWEMTNRWSCSPGWSWFGGRSDEVASIWNKRKFSGDLSVQCYFAFKMDTSGTKAWRDGVGGWMERPADFAITTCGDGTNLGSGYSFIVAAENNQHCVLLKQGKVVMESSAPEAILASNIDGKVDTNKLHRKWWFAKINKIGDRVECWLDNNLLFTYTDPKPLNDGQMALWTYSNGIMLARVQIFYENEVRSSLAHRPKTPGGKVVAVATHKSN